jgi:hypothetical protein
MSDLLDIAVRAWTPPRKPPRKATKIKAPEPRIPERLLIIDTETTTDETQRLNFGVYRYCRVTETDGELTLTTLQEGIFYADDLPERAPAGYELLKDYAASHTAETARGQIDAVHALSLEPLGQWLKRVFWRAAYLLRAGIVCFNLPFDLSRLASRVGETRNRSRGQDPFAGGFSFVIWTHSKDGQSRESRYRPRLAIKAIDSKRSLKGFRKPDIPDPKNLIPEDPGTTTPDAGWSFRGHLLDLRTLVFALTDRGHSLESACEAFGVPYIKRDVEHGKITEEYVDYCREDVAATQDLAEASLTEFLRHPIDLQATRAYSAATIGKGYLRAIGIHPLLERQEFDAKLLGHAMSAYYGGRTEVRIRRTPLPVVYLDFLSMYPTGCALMSVWDLLAAERVDVIDVTEEINILLETITVDDCFDPGLWPRLIGIAQIVPDGDILPVRAGYSATPGWQIGVNPLHGTQPMWFTLADLVASKLLTGKAPRVIRALRFQPRGKAPGLQSVSLLGEVPVSPEEDFFKAVIEQRKRAQQRDTDEESRRAKSLKVIANSTSYGIYAQMTRHELGPGRNETVEVHGYRDEPHSWNVAAPEEPGEYSFPPLAACITGAARLQLATLERLVTDHGGSHVFCDTDSMAIVATETGGLIPCPGGQHITVEDQPAIRALSFEQVETIRRRFEALNPYDPDVASGSILEVEDENYTDKTRTTRRQLHCLAISAKRYVLYELTGDGQPVLVKWSGHGLGHLLNPTDPDSEDRDWTRQAWEWLLRKQLGLPAPEPSWLDQPAIGRHSISGPALHRLLATLNEGLTYTGQIKPFNFLSIAFVHPLERPPDDPRLVLIAPSRDTVAEQLAQPWLNRYSGKPYTITTEPSNSRQRPGLLTVKTYRAMLAEYAVHPEAKSNGPDRESCTRQTTGVLGRRPVDVRAVAHIGKEANRLDEVQAGLVQGSEEFINAYDDVDYRVFQDWALPSLRQLGAREIARRTGHSVGAVHGVLRGAIPRPEALHRYVAVARALHRTNASSRRSPSSDPAMPAVSSSRPSEGHRD